MIYDVTLCIDADESEETANRLYEAGFDDGIIGRRYGKTYVRITRRGPSWFAVALEALNQLQGTGFTVTGAEWNRGAK